ncbi:hypothetical protein KC573_02705 [candidate division WWE3 bacterium]|uniref:Amino acid permease n=1 Tax=candidate division WWE3 bacterium TaxID=2053526 RepID=A0A955LWX7_UNCKA|nr:hypothetical protein [candidate division WWE3 bacterium]
MNSESRRLWPALFTLVGTTIGAGILALPYTFMQSGLLYGVAHLLVVLVLTLLMNLTYAEILVDIRGKHQLAGYVNIFLGSKGKYLATIALVVGAYGALLAYTTQSGVFLNTLFPSISAQTFSVLFYGFVVAVTLMNLKFFSMIELAMVLSLLALMSIIVSLGIPQMSVDNLSTVGRSLEHILLPYGVLLFAFSGYSVLPEIGRITQYDPSLLKKAILGGTGLVALVYLGFSTVVLGVSGQGTSQDGITGLLPFLETHIVQMGIVIGVLAIGTSFISMGHVLRDLYQEDLSLSGPLAWFLAVYPSLLLFLAGQLSFVRILEFTGALTVGLSGILLFIMYIMLSKDPKREFSVIKVPRTIMYIAMVIFASGVLYEIVRNFA